MTIGYDTYMITDEELEVGNHEETMNLLADQALTDVHLESSTDPLLVRADDLSWQDLGLCSQTDPESFFPESGAVTSAVKKVCNNCEVREVCLEYGIANDERFGIWGGLGIKELRRLKKARAATTFTD